VIVHHQVDNNRHHPPHDFGALGYLAAVDAAVPGGAAVEELIAEGVEPVEHDAQQKEQKGAGYI